MTWWWNDGSSNREPLCDAFANDWQFADRSKAQAGDRSLTIFPFRKPFLVASCHHGALGEKQILTHKRVRKDWRSLRKEALVWASRGGPSRSE
jgi:hypothetical protein